jgi:hypothetical protein
MRRCILFLVAVVVVACGKVSGPDVDAGGDPPGPPSVVSTAPANMEAGVAPDATLVVTFSKAMNQASVEAAWTSADLPPTQVAFAWNASGDTLTVTPNQPLPVATGTGLDPSTVIAKEITYTIAATATDTTGQPLTSSLAVKFTTVRRLTASVGPIDALTQAVFNDGTVVSPPDGSVGKSDFTNVFSRVFASFNLPTLPAGAVVESAVFSGTQFNVTGSPYAKLGSLKAQHVNFPAFDANTFSATPLGNVIGDFSTTATLEIKMLDVTSQVSDDYANTAARGGRSQYRLEFPLGTNNDGVKDFARFTRTAFALAVTYTVD